MAFIKTFPRVPGLSLHVGVIESTARLGLLGQVMALRSNILNVIGSDANTRSEAIIIPQPHSVQSVTHNLAADERFFQRLKVQDESSDPARVLNCEHFQEYGSTNHSLTYFQRESSIPWFARAAVIQPILQPLLEFAKLPKMPIKSLRCYAGV
eukprot:m.131874 g.131874  ORF g.131874 m.131874 type:complete len:153 (+) comp29573_c0_seq3:151-609(+)